MTLCIIFDFVRVLMYVDRKCLCNYIPLLSESKWINLFLHTNKYRAYIFCISEVNVNDPSHGSSYYKPTNQFHEWLKTQLLSAHGHIAILDSPVGPVLSTYYNVFFLYQ